VAENKGTFELCPFFFIQSSCHGLRGKPSDVQTQNGALVSFAGSEPGSFATTFLQVLPRSCSIATICCDVFGGVGEQLIPLRRQL
jgi:hypothetical protein